MTYSLRVLRALLALNSMTLSNYGLSSVFSEKIREKISQLTGHH